VSLTIPTRTDLEDYDLQANLDDVIFTLRFRWNRRLGLWFMDVADEDGGIIQASIAVVIDFPLGARMRDSRWVGGFFLAVDTSTAHTDAGVTDLGDRVQLLYFQASELPIDPSVPPTGG
jgi:uncharacterized protein DUF6983